MVERTLPQLRDRPFEVAKDDFGTFVRIDAGNERVLLLDIADYAKEPIAFGYWHFYESCATSYCAQRIKGNKTIILHRVLMETPKGLVVDHIDANGLNCRRHNMRNCTRAQNTAYHHNRTRRSNSGYIGVQETPSGKFTACITEGAGTLTFLGLFPTAEEAARVRDRAAFARNGEFARLNFPDEFTIP